MHDGANKQADCTVLTGSNLDHLPTFADCTIDSCVTDPPYELGFMGKAWDKSGIAYNVELWREVYRVLKPGAYLLAFGSSRGHHRMFCAIEDAGFEIRDTITWLFGSGFPKSLNVTKAMQQIISADAQCVCVRRSTQIVRDSQSDYQDHPRLYDEQPLAALEDGQDVFPLPADAPEHIRGDQHLGDPSSLSGDMSYLETMSNTDHLSMSDSPGQTFHQSKESPTNGNRPSDTAQNTSHVLSTVEHKTEPDTLGNSHLDDDSVSFSLDTVYPYIPQCSTCGKHKIPEGFGTALKPAAEYICMARKPLEKGLTVAQNVLKWGTGAINIDKCRIEIEANPKNGVVSPGMRDSNSGFGGGMRTDYNTSGRFPANVIHDGSDEVEAGFPQTASGLMKGGTVRASQDEPSGVCFGVYGGNAVDSDTYADQGSAARFFYSPKASKYDREAGLDLFEEKRGGSETFDPKTRDGVGDNRMPLHRNSHPTVKPTDLMQYLCRLVTPPGGLILDPFLGSGSTMKAALIERFRCIGIELNPEYAEIARARLTQLQVKLF